MAKITDRPAGSINPKEGTLGFIGPADQKFGGSQKILIFQKPVTLFQVDTLSFDPEMFCLSYCTILITLRYISDQISTPNRLIHKFVHLVILGLI